MGRPERIGVIRSSVIRLLRLDAAAGLVLLLAITLPHLGQGDWRGDTGWYAALGLDAWRRGEPLMLSSGEGLPYFNKPPLALWIHGLVLHAAGPDLAAARLPSLLAAALVIIGSCGVVRELGGRRAAWWCGVLLAPTIEFFRRCREISLDLWQAAFMMLGCWLVARAARAERPAWMVLAGLPVGLALLTKPFMGLAACALWGVWAVLAGRARWLGWVALSACVAGLVALPWHAFMVLRFGDAFTDRYVGGEVAARAAGEAVGGQTGQPWWFYLARLATGGWPVMLGVLAAAVLAARGRLSGVRAAIFGLVWTLGWLLLLTIFPDRRDRYALPIWPGLAVIAGVGLAALPWSSAIIAQRALRRWLIPVAAVGGVVFAMLPVRVQRPPDPQWTEFHAWHRAEGWPTLFDGSFGGAPAARVFLASGAWPVPTLGHGSTPLASPPPGALVAYHRRGGRGPGPDETELFRSGDLVVTRVGGAWRPVDTPDPGE